MGTNHHQMKDPASRLNGKYRMLPSGCWEWIAAKSVGYGVIGVGRRGEGNLRAHRLAYELFEGPIPKGMVYTISVKTGPVSIRAISSR